MNDLPLSPDDVAEIVSILDGGGYDTLEIRTARYTLRILRQDKGDGGAWTQSWTYADTPSSAPVAEAVSDLVAAPLGAAIVRAPLPGTFYRAPQPGARPYVEIGDKVGADAVLGLIETMKLMTPVHAGAAGLVEAILVENATMVDGGAVLIHIRPDAA